MKRPVKISAVSYLNTIPFVYGIMKKTDPCDFILELDVPSMCARKLIHKEVDIALIPVGAIPEVENPELITNYCIGAVQSVKTVVLLSQEPLNNIDKIYLDFDSRTSVQLVKVLAENYWKIKPVWENLLPGEADKITGKDAIVAIGDKTFELVKRYKFVYDLAEEWICFTSLPFVFAAWMSNKELPETTILSLNDALAYGIDHKPDALRFFKDKLPKNVNCLDYLENNISFILDDEKRKGMELFLKYISNDYGLRITDYGRQI